VTPRPAQEAGEPKPVSWLNRLLRTTPPSPSPSGPVLGYAGFWALVDEAHLANIAVAPEWRGRGLGELLLVTVIDRAVELGLAVVTLEVRVSNLRAQKLYRKYGFEVVGERRHYYSDNGENAYIMTTGIITSAAYQRRLAELKEALHAKLRAQTAPPPAE
jgi:ribosomal-protein-alanine N-acetyltransferase